MKNTKISIKSALFAALLAIMVIFSACSENSNIFGPSQNESISINTETGNLTSNISVEVVKGNVDGYYFKVTNNMTDTIINDFHVQFIDTTTAIIGFSTFPSGWIMDNNTTDRSKGKIGVKAGQFGQPIQPGQIGRPLWIDVKITRRPSMDFNWQATRDGIVLAAGSGSLPR